jgi:dihydrofolate reductase
MTRTPSKYQKQEKAGVLEFCSGAPKQIVKMVSARGHQNILIAGGGEINRAFLDAGLINEMLITVEPKVFGSGTELFSGSKKLHSFKLISVKKLNRLGTLLLKYAC